MGGHACRAGIRDQLLDAAGRLFERYGYSKTTVEDIAHEAGISRATVYLHLKGKEEIALAWVERHHDRLQAELEAIAGLPEPPICRLRRMLLARVLFRLDVAQPYGRSIDELFAALRGALLAQRERHREEEARLMARVLAEGAAAGAFTCPEPLRAAGLLVLATDALLPYNLSARQLGERAEIESKARGLIDLLLDGLCRRK